MIEHVHASGRRRCAGTGRAWRSSIRRCCPRRERWLDARPARPTPRTAIRRLAVRGAPLIGIAAAYGLAMEVGAPVAGRAGGGDARAARGARPTAVNLAWAVERVRAAALAPAGGADGGRAAEAERIARRRGRRERGDRRATAPTCWPARGGSSPTATPARWPTGGARVRAGASSSSLPRAATSRCSPARRARCCRARG